MESDGKAIFKTRRKFGFPGQIPTLIEETIYFHNGKFYKVEYMGGTRTSSRPIGRKNVIIAVMKCRSSAPPHVDKLLNWLNGKGELPEFTVIIDEK